MTLLPTPISSGQSLKSIVEDLTHEAFWNVYRPGCTEHYVLNQYRTNPDFIPELDFVMEESEGDNQSSGRIIGHILFSKAKITLDDGSNFDYCSQFIDEMNKKSQVP